jgi:hypothetical protein
MAETSFQPDPKVAQIAEAYAADAVGVAAQTFGVTLDWSESSIQHVEQMLARLHEQMAMAKPSEDEVWTFAKGLGSYVGEVFRRHRGAQWGTITMNGQTFPGLRQSNGALVWPWSKAHKRLTNGPEDNVWHYYQVLTQDENDRSPSRKNDESKPWWKFW